MSVPQKIEFGQLDDGNFFEVEGALHIKLNYEECGTNARNLKELIYCRFDRDDLVNRVKINNIDYNLWMAKP